MNPVRITFGDKVRIRSSSATEALGIAGKTGLVYGTTTPSVTGVRVVGNSIEDHAISVTLDGRNDQLWFPDDLVEFVDHQPGTTVSVAGRRLIRDENGEWREVKPQ
jgi:hypothetical protein